MKIAYIFLNAELLGEKSFYKNFIEKNRGDIFCADGGANISYLLELNPLEIWGDMDSIKDEVLKYYETGSVIIKKFSKEKDKTDSELLLEYLFEKKYKKIYCIAGLGGDIAHELTNINLCFKYQNLCFLTEENKLFSIEGKEVFKDLKDREISFIIYSDSVEKLTLKGFKYEIQDLKLLRGDSRCMSNIIAQDLAEISFKSGKLLAVLKNRMIWNKS